MPLSGCCQCAKYLMVVLNFLFWIIGLFFVICSIWMLTDPRFLLSMTQQTTDYNIALYIFLVSGIFIIIGAFLGCCGAYRESTCQLIWFFCLLLVVLVAQIAAGAWAFHNKDKLEETVRNAVKYSVQEEYSQLQSRTETFDDIQKNLKCCGANSPHDWAASKYNMVDRTNGVSVAISNTNTFFLIPASCCREDLNLVTCEADRKMKVSGLINPTIYQTGCIDKVVDLLHHHAQIICAVTIVIIILEIIALILAISLCCTIKKDSYKA